MILWFAILGAWAVSFLFAGIEAGLLSVDPVRLRYHVKQRTAGAVRLNRLLKHPERLLVTVLLITNLANILGLLLLTKLLVASLGYGGFFVAGVVALPIYLFVLNVLPKSLFRRFPFRALAALGGVLEGTSIVLWPFLEVGRRIGGLFLPRRAADRGRLFAAREELKQIAEQSEREGVLTSTERAMIHNVVDFRIVKVRDVMVPLHQLVTVRPETSIEHFFTLTREAGAERLPVITADGKATGLLDILDVLLDKSPPRSLGDYVRRIIFVGEDEPAYRVIQKLRAARLGFAAVVDPQKNLIGIATGEDMIKRLVSSAA
jgi:CBS domain containing-hemolysin-like protein